LLLITEYYRTGALWSLLGAPDAVYGLIDDISEQLVVCSQLLECLGLG
jgi:hypothetical protein